MHRAEKMNMDGDNTLDTGPVPSSKMGRGTTKGTSCSGSMWRCPELSTLTWGRQTTTVPGMLAWLWYQLRTVPGISPHTMVLGEGRLSLGRKTQHDCSSTWGAFGGRHQKQKKKQITKIHIKD